MHQKHRKIFQSNEYTKILYLTTCQTVNDKLKSWRHYVDLSYQTGDPCSSLVCNEKENFKNDTFDLATP